MPAALRFGVLTLSDRSASHQRPDASGPALIKAVREQGWVVRRQEVIPDDFDSILAILKNWSQSEELDVILTTGGTGFSPRDVTPEATLAVVDRLAPGIAEAIRSASLRITPHAMLSRAIAGICFQTLIINLPGSPKGALESLQVVMPVLAHAVDLLRADPHAEAGHAQAGHAQAGHAKTNADDPPARSVDGEENGLPA